MVCSFSLYLPTLHRKWPWPHDEVALRKSWQNMESGDNKRGAALAVQKCANLITYCRYRKYLILKSKINYFVCTNRLRYSREGTFQSLDYVPPTRRPPAPHRVKYKHQKYYRYGPPSRCFAATYYRSQSKGQISRHGFQEYFSLRTTERGSLPRRPGRFRN